MISLNIVDNLMSFFPMYQDQLVIRILDWYLFLSTVKFQIETKFESIRLQA